MNLYIQLECPIFHIDYFSKYLLNYFAVNIIIINIF